MSDGYWSLEDRLVISGCGVIAIVGLFLGLQLPSMPMDEEQQPPREAPTIQVGQADQPEYVVQTSEQPALRVVVLETPEQARGAGERQRRAEEHDAADLQAQIEAADGSQRAAASAERQEVPTLVLAIIGTIIAAAAVGLSLWSARVTNLTARAQIRAYIQVELADIVPNMFLPARVHLSAKLRNVGQTPAYSMDSRANIYTCDKPPTDADYAQIDGIFDVPPTEQAEITIGAGVQTFAIKEFNNNGLPFEGDFGRDLALAMAGEKTVMFAGRVDYKDVFGRPHVTRFCHIFEWRNGRWTSRYHERGNHAD